MSAPDQSGYCARQLMFVSGWLAPFAVMPQLVLPPAGIVPL